MSRPNIVYIMADDMGFGDPGCYGATKIPTPNMDRLAREGMRFTDAHSASAVCTPSRYAALTGRYCWRTRLQSGVMWGYSPPLIDDDRPTVATMLRDTGYATAAVGKWHLGLGWNWREPMPDDPVAIRTEFGHNIDHERPLYPLAERLGLRLLLRHPRLARHAALLLRREPRAGRYPQRREGPLTTRSSARA
jgi:arylsulfatase A